MLHVESIGMALGLLLVMHCIVQTDIGPGLSTYLQVCREPRGGLNMALIFVQSELDDVLQFRQDYTMDDDNRDRREMECYRLSMISFAVSCL
jgi:hypothetical protein